MTTTTFPCDVRVVRPAPEFLVQCTGIADTVALYGTAPDFGKYTVVQHHNDDTSITVLECPTFARVCWRHVDLLTQHPGWETGPTFLEVCHACSYVTSPHGATQADNAHENLCCGSSSSCQWPLGECVTHDMRYATIDGVTPPGPQGDEAAHDAQHAAWLRTLGGDGVMADDIPDDWPTCGCGWVRDPEWTKDDADRQAGKGDTDPGDYEDFGPVVNPDGTPTAFTLGMFRRDA